MDQLTHGTGEVCGYRYVFVFTVALGILYNYISGLTLLTLKKDKILIGPNDV